MGMVRTDRARFGIVRDAASLHWPGSSGYCMMAIDVSFVVVDMLYMHIPTVLASVLVTLYIAVVFLSFQPEEKEKVFGTMIL